jgi:hypothetical protein
MTELITWGAFLLQLFSFFVSLAKTERMPSRMISAVRATNGASPAVVNGGPCCLREGGTVLQLGLSAPKPEAVNNRIEPVIEESQCQTRKLFC